MRFCNSSMAKLCALAPSEPVPPCFLIDRGSHGHFFERAAELRTGQFERPANFDLFARTVVSATKGCGHPERRLTRFTFAYKGEFEKCGVCFVGPGAALFNPFVAFKSIMQAAIAGKQVIG